MYKIRLQILRINEPKIDFLLLKKSLLIGSKEIFLTIKYIYVFEILYWIVVFKDMIHTAKSSPKSIMTLKRCIQYEEMLLKRHPKAKNMEWC